MKEKTKTKDKTKDKTNIKNKIQAKDKMKTRTTIRRLGIYISRLALGGLALILLINLFVLGYARPYLVDASDLAKAPAKDAILVLGAGIRNNRPSLMLQARLDAAADLYRRGVSERILVSGDNGQINYNEVIVMKNYLEEKNIPPDHIYMDHAGFNTYDSLYRARDVFQIESLVISTQYYHSHRALYIGRRLGLEAYAFKGNTRHYPFMIKYQFREALARCKDLIQVEIIKPEPRYLGEPITLYPEASLSPQPEPAAQARLAGPALT